MHSHSLHFCCFIPLLDSSLPHPQFASKIPPKRIPFINPRPFKDFLPHNDHKHTPFHFSTCCAASRNVGIEHRPDVDEHRPDVDEPLSAGTDIQVLKSATEALPEEQQGGQKPQGYLISANGWEVLRVHHDESDLLRQFAEVQAKAFHVPTSVFNDFFFTLFKAEVLSSLLYKMRNATSNRYACLVAVPESMHLTRREVVGVVDAAAMADRDVLRCLPGVDEYLYISGMAVDAKYRRQKVGTVLLQACDLTALQWGFEVLVLQAYEDDTAARNLYSRAGYRVISSDPLWLSKWLGKRRRVVLAKKTTEYCRFIHSL